MNDQELKELQNKIRNLSILEQTKILSLLSRNLFSEMETEIESLDVNSKEAEYTSEAMDSIEQILPLFNRALISLLSRNQKS